MLSAVLSRSAHWSRLQPSILPLPSVSLLPPTHHFSLIPTLLYQLSLISLPPPIWCLSHCVHVLDAHWPLCLPLCLYLTSFAFSGQVSWAPSSLPPFFPRAHSSLTPSPQRLRLPPSFVNGVIAVFLPQGTRDLGALYTSTHPLLVLALHLHRRGDAHARARLNCLQTFN